MGFPVLVKDKRLRTGDRMMTTAGSLALAGVHAAARMRRLVARLPRPPVR